MIYEFGPFRYDGRQRLLFRGEEVVPLVPKAIDTLHALIEQRGQVVEKGDLMKLVWPDAQVEETGLARNISTLRKALGDESDQGAYIETIPRRGYRFVAEVRALDGVFQPAAGIPAAPAPRTRRILGLSLAGALVAVAGLVYWQFYLPSRYLPRGNASLGILPFECLSPELERAAFPQGLNEVLAASLSGLDGVHVTSPSTIRRYQEKKAPTAVMARVLGLDVILEGIVQLQGDNVRVTARLADVHSGKLIWAASYDYPARDPGAAQSAAAREISAQVGAHLLIR